MKKLQDIFEGRYDSTRKMPPKKPISHAFKEEIGGKIRTAGLMAPGVITGLTGTTGIGKTTLTHMFAAATILGDQYENIVYTPINQKQNKVLVINTEMQDVDEFYSYKNNLEVFLKRGGFREEVNDHLIGLNLMDVPTAEEKKVMFFSILDQVAQGGLIPTSRGPVDLSEIGLIIIDNVQDMVTDYSDDNQILPYLTRLQTSAKKCHIPFLIIAHTESGGNKMANRFGTILEQKLSCIIMCSRKQVSNPTIVTPYKKSRLGRPFRPLELTWDEDGFPSLSGEHFVGSAYDNISSQLGLSGV